MWCAGTPVIFPQGRWPVVFLPRWPVRPRGVGKGSTLLTAALLAVIPPRVGGPAHLAVPQSARRSVFRHVFQPVSWVPARA